MDYPNCIGPPRLKEYNCEKISEDCYKLNLEVDGSNRKKLNATKKYCIEMDSSNLDAILIEFNKIKNIYVETHKNKKRNL